MNQKESLTILQRASEVFSNYVEQIELAKISDVAIRRAIKKYDVKNLKINNVTPIRSKKIYNAILPKYESGVTTDKSWLQNQRRLFIWCVVCYLFKHSLEITELKNEDYEFFQAMFPFKEQQLIKFQIYGLIKKDNKNSSWKEEEDSILSQIVIAKDNDGQVQWSNIAKQFFAATEEKYFRNAKQCRERWLNHLDPKKTKGKWLPDQDKVLLKQVLNRGKKWSQISIALENKKNEHMVKNRYKSLIHKKQKQLKTSKLKENDIIVLILKDVQNVKKQQCEHFGSDAEQGSQKGKNYHKYMENMNIDEEIRSQKDSEEFSCKQEKQLSQNQEDSQGQNIENVKDEEQMEIQYEQEQQLSKKYTNQPQRSTKNQHQGEYIQILEQKSLKNHSQSPLDQMQEEHGSQQRQRYHQKRIEQQEKSGNENERIKNDRNFVQGKMKGKQLFKEKDKKRSHNNSGKKSGQNLKGKVLPIIVQPGNKKSGLSPIPAMEAVPMMGNYQEELQQDCRNEVEIYGNRNDNDMYERLFQNANTPNPGGMDNSGNNRFPALYLDSRSPASLFMSPYPPAGWTPTIFFMEGPNVQVSPQVSFGNFYSKFKSDFHKFVGKKEQKPTQNK